MARAPHLFQNLAVGGVQTRNRLWLAPMTNLQSHEDGTLSDAELHWLEARAQGGFGVIETCATHVAPDGKAWAGELGIHDDHTTPGWRRIAESTHAAGARVFAQLFHGGARALPGVEPWSASTAPNVREGSEDDIRRAIDAFAQAARRAADAGIDGVELHGAHGYLLCQFLNAATNHRTDGWGGALAQRARLLLEVFDAVSANTPTGFAVGCRLSPETWGPGPRSGEPPQLDIDEMATVARWLAERGAAFIHVSLWDAKLNAIKYPDRHPLSVFREAVGAETPLVVAGNVWTRADAEALLELGADAVALGRVAIANPRWPIEAEAPDHQPRRPPLTAAELSERALSPTFIDYMRRWKGFVAD